MARAPGKDSSAILTLPNAISSARILLIPVFAALIIHRGTELAGLLVFGAVACTDWIDGAVARRSGSVTELGKILDPAADRLVVAAALVALLVRGVFPLWAALLILVRDAAVLSAGAALMFSRRVRVDVRFVGKSATFGLMCGVPLVAWGNLGFVFEHAALALGWTCYAVAIVLYYVAAALYARDLRQALGSGGRSTPPA
jgi:cardiolipin synthase